MQDPREEVFTSPGPPNSGHARVCNPDASTLGSSSPAFAASSVQVDLPDSNIQENNLSSPSRPVPLRLAIAPNTLCQRTIQRNNTPRDLGFDSDSLHVVRDSIEPSDQADRDHILHHRDDRRRFREGEIQRQRSMTLATLSSNSRSNSGDSEFLTSAVAMSPVPMDEHEFEPRDDDDESDDGDEHLASPQEDLELWFREISSLPPGPLYDHYHSIGSSFSVSKGLQPSSTLAQDSEAQESSKTYNQTSNGQEEYGHWDSFAQGSFLRGNDDGFKSNVTGSPAPLRVEHSDTHDETEWNLESTLKSATRDPRRSSSSDYNLAGSPASLSVDAFDRYDNEHHTTRDTRLSFNSVLNLAGSPASSSVYGIESYAERECGLEEFEHPTASNANLPFVSDGNYFGHRSSIPNHYLRSRVANTNGFSGQCEKSDSQDPGVNFKSPQENRTTPARAYHRRRAAPAMPAPLAPQHSTYTFGGNLNSPSFNQSYDYPSQLDSTARVSPIPHREPTTLLNACVPGPTTSASSFTAVWSNTSSYGPWPAATVEHERSLREIFQSPKLRIQTDLESLAESPAELQFDLQAESSVESPTIAASEEETIDTLETYDSEAPTGVLDLLPQQAQAGGVTLRRILSHDTLTELPPTFPRLHQRGKAGSIARNSYTRGRPDLSSVQPPPNGVTFEEKAFLAPHGLGEASLDHTNASIFDDRDVLTSHMSWSDDEEEEAEPKPESTRLKRLASRLTPRLSIQSMRGVGVTAPDSKAQASSPSKSSNQFTTPGRRRSTLSSKASPSFKSSASPRFSIFSRSSKGARRHGSPVVASPAASHYILPETKRLSAFGSPSTWDLPISQVHKASLHPQRDVLFRRSSAHGLVKSLSERDKISPVDSFNSGLVTTTTESTRKDSLLTPEPDTEPTKKKKNVCLRIVSSITKAAMSLEIKAGDELLNPPGSMKTDRPTVDKGKGRATLEQLETDPFWQENLALHASQTQINIANVHQRISGGKNKAEDAIELNDIIRRVHPVTRSDYMNTIVSPTAGAGKKWWAENEQFNKHLAGDQKAQLVNDAAAVVMARSASIREAASKPLPPSPGPLPYSPGMLRHSPGLWPSSPNMLRHSPSPLPPSPGQFSSSPGLPPPSPGPQSPSPRAELHYPGRLDSPKPFSSSANSSPNRNKLIPRGDPSAMRETIGLIEFLKEDPPAEYNSARLHITDIKGFGRRPPK